MQDHVQHLYLRECLFRRTPCHAKAFHENHSACSATRIQARSNLCQGRWPTAVRPGSVCFSVSRLSQLASPLHSTRTSWQRPYCETTLAEQGRSIICRRSLNLDEARSRSVFDMAYVSVLRLAEMQPTSPVRGSPNAAQHENTPAHSIELRNGNDFIIDDHWGWGTPTIRIREAWHVRTIYHCCCFS